MASIYKLLNVKRDVKVPAMKIESGRKDRLTIKIPYNKELSGHAHSKTSEIYTHACLCRAHGRQTSKTGLANIKNMLYNIKRRRNNKFKQR